MKDRSGARKDYELMKTSDFFLAANKANEIALFSQKKSFASTTDLLTIILWLVLTKAEGVAIGRE